MPATRHVVPDVEQLRFGPESDNYCQALRIALQHRGESLSYREISSWSGRAFSTCWNDQCYFWDKHLSAPDPDAEGYLRSDFLTATNTRYPPMPMVWQHMTGPSTTSTMTARMLTWPTSTQD